MTKRDGRVLARMNEERVLKALLKYGWLRTRDLAALGWSPSSSTPSKGGFTIKVIKVPGSALRMAQRTVRRLNAMNQVIAHTAPDGSIIYGLSEGGARTLQALGIPARSSKDWLRRFSAQQFHHRRLANEVAISASLQGYRVATEREIATGHWLGGVNGIRGKKPDVLVRAGRLVWWIEVERSRKNQSDHIKLLSWLQRLWPNDRNPGDKVYLPGEYILEKVVFIANRAFGSKLATDLKRYGWTDEQISIRIFHIPLLYVSDTKFLTKEIEADLAGPA